MSERQNPTAGPPKLTAELVKGWLKEPEVQSAVRFPDTRLRQCHAVGCRGDSRPAWSNAMT